MASPPPREVSLWSLSLGLYPGAILWGFQLWVSFGLVNVACGHGFEPMFHLVSLVFAALTALTIRTAYGLWRDLRLGSLAVRGAPGRARFMALSGIVANSYFLLLIVVGAIPSFLFNPCVS